MAQKTLCHRTDAFFSGLSAHMAKIYIKGGNCADSKCEYPVADHAVAPPAAAPVGVVGAHAPATDVRLAPSFVPVEDPEKQFEKAMQAFRKGPLLRDDYDGVCECVSALDARMHDGSSSFVHVSFHVSGECDDTRKFSLRPDLPDSVTARQDLARSLKAAEDIGVEYLKLLKAVARQRHFATQEVLAVRCDKQGLSCEIVAIETFSRNRIRPMPGVIMPPSKHWTSNQQALWFGLFLITCPPQLLVSVTTELVISMGEKYRAAHASTFWDKPVHDYKFAKLATATTSAIALGDSLAASGGGGRTKRDRDHEPAREEGKPKKKKYTKAEVKAYKKERAAAAAAASASKASDAPQLLSSSTASGTLAASVSLASAAAGSKSEPQPQQSVGGRSNVWTAGGRGGGRGRAN